MLSSCISVCADEGANNAARGVQCSKYEMLNHHNDVNVTILVSINMVCLKMSYYIVNVFYNVRKYDGIRNLCF